MLEVTERNADMVNSGRRVVFVTPTLTHYRVKFHELVRTQLALSDVEYVLVYGQPGPGETEKGDLADLAWATKIHNVYGPSILRRAVWQPYFKVLRANDFVIVDHENRLLSNYVLLLLRRFWRVRAALWGHGRNFQSTRPNGFAERWKRAWARRGDWWFTYTDQTAALIAGYGYSRDRITVFENSIDTREITKQASQIDAAALGDLRARLGLETENIAVYVGGLYQEKRLAFLIEASRLVREAILDFVLIVVGGGPDREQIEAAALEYSWLKYQGPRFGREKIEVLKLGKLFLMPGLVGLAIVDCGAMGLPIVTTNFPYHSPEIAYLRNGVNGIVVDDWQDPRRYAEAIVLVLRDENLRARLCSGARENGAQFTIENMADKFSRGVLTALSAS